MNFFKKIWKNIRGFFTKRPPSTEKIISEEKAVLEEMIVMSEIYSRIEESTNADEKADLINKIAKHNTAKSIIDFVDNETKNVLEKTKGRKKLYELYELRTELQILEEKRANLNFKESQIKHAQYPDTSSFDNRINNLFTQLSKNKIEDKVRLTDISISAFDKSFQQLEKLLTDKSALQRHLVRERVEKVNINNAIQKINELINQNNLTNAKDLIEIVRKSIQNNKKWKNEIKSFGKIESKYKSAKEETDKILKQQQEELLKQQALEARKIKEIQEQKLEEQRIAREQQLVKQKIEEERKAEKVRKLKALLNKKANWRDFQKILQENNITILYHFTDLSNLKSIKENGGLYSWYYCDRNNIVIPMTGNSSLGRSLDLEFGLEDYVRLSFIKDHPMKHVAMNEGRVTKPYILKVSIDVCYFENTRFSDMNAADKRHTNDDSIDFLNSLRFDLFQRRYFDLNPIEKKLHQAEILVKTWIPAEYITNINEVA